MINKRCYDNSMHNINEKNKVAHDDEYQELVENPVAYFCTEYALTDDMPMAGGLGVLAADTVREAYDQGLPMVAIGLFYDKGYETTSRLSGRIFTPEEFGLKPVLDRSGEKVSVSVECMNKDVVVKAFVYDQGSIPIYFLTTNVEENESEESKITEYLYVNDRKTRFLQEMIIGIGGVKLLEALGINPSVYHMNDSYSALLSFELAKNIMKSQNVSQAEALELASKKIAYTNHTLVAAGNDAFEQKEVEKYLSRYALVNNLNLKELVLHGHVSGEELFSMTILALKMAYKINCVSKIHAEKAKVIWPEFSIRAITNGIHIPTWDLSTNQDLIVSHRDNKRELIKYINNHKGLEWQEEDLIICWAKRIVSYKRPFALFENIEKLTQLVNQPERKIRIIVSGIAHAGDSECQEAINKIRGYTDKELRGNLVFLENYSTELARKLTSGSDVWLNTPEVGWEACGTSTMKAALNGTLVCSTKDGWLDEVGLEKIGWTLENAKINKSILDTIENKIIPEFFQSGQDEFGNDWKTKMNSARLLIMEDFSTAKMINNYFKDLYLPIEQN